MEIFAEYFKKDNALSRADARIKLIAALALLIMVISCRGFFFPVFVTIACIILCVLIEVPLRVFVLRFSEPLYIALILLLMKFLFSGKTPMVTFDVLGIAIIGHSDGLVDGLLTFCRVLGAVSVVAVLGFSTKFTEIAAGLAWLKVPKPLIEVMLFAYRFIFVFLEDGRTIYAAQKNRLGYSGLRKGLNSSGILAGSLILRSFDQSQKTTEAMVQRGYVGSLPFLESQPLKLIEAVSAAIVIVFAGTIWMTL